MSGGLVVPGEMPAQRRRRPETWRDALALYHTAQAAAGRSRGTVRLHRHYLAQLRERHRRPWSVTTIDLRDLLATEHWSAETRKSCRTVVRGFYRWAHGSGYVDDDPASVLEPVRVPEGTPKPTPPVLVRATLAAGDDRIKLMVMLAAYCGLRCCEIARVHARDVVDGVLHVQGKGKRERWVPIPDVWLLTRLEALDGYAFPSRATDRHLTPGHVSRLLSAALPGQWTGHTLRHRAATSGLGATGDLLAVMRFLGHSRPETTIRYTALRDEAVLAVARGAVSGVA